MEKVISTFTASQSTETLRVEIHGEETDIIEQVIITNTDTSEVVSNQTLRRTVPTSEARDAIAAATKGA